MNRGEVWWVSFEPAIGGEVRKLRPAVIISNNASNKFLNRVQIVPITSKIDRLYPSEAYVMLNEKKCKTMADQLTTASKLRLLNLEGRLSNSDMQKVEHAVRVQLGLSI